MILLCKQTYACLPVAQSPECYSASTLTRGVSHEQLVSYLWLKNMRSRSRVPMEWRAVGTMLQMLNLLLEQTKG